MGWEFPATSQTRIGFWGEPQYTRKGVLLLTWILGIFGFHHLYLRSPQTAFLFFFGNMFSLGYWWFYDIIQLSTHSSEELNTYGLSTPFGAAGIAQGMFQCGTSGAGGGEGESTTPHPIWFALSCLLLPLAPFSMLVAGDYGGAFIRFVSLILFFLFPFLFLSYFYDLYQVLVKPADVLKNGFSRFFPFTYFGFDGDNHSPRIQTPIGKKEEPESGCKPAGLLPSFFNFLASGFAAFVTAAMPILAYVLPPPALAALSTVVELPKQVIPIAEKTVDTVTEKVIPLAEKSMNTAVKLGKLAVDVPTAISSSLESAGVKAKGLGASPFAPPAPLQSGGGPQMTTADKWAAGGIAALVGGGFLLTAGRSFLDALRHYNGPTDSPPNNA